MEKDERFARLPERDVLEKTANALEQSGITTIVVETEEEAKGEVLKLIPKDAEVMNMTSRTLEGIDLAREIGESGRFDSVRRKIMAMDTTTQASQIRRLGAAPDWTVGSVHAVTQDGHVLIASASGSQLPAYVFGAGHVIWVAGAQKIVKNVEEGMERIYKYSFPLEDERAREAYGVGSGVNKIVIINKETRPNRITMILVNRKLGF